MNTPISLIIRSCLYFAMLCSPCTLQAYTGSLSTDWRAAFTQHRTTVSNDSEIQSLKSIELAVKSFIEQELRGKKADVVVNNLDSRIRLVACTDSLKAQWSSGSRRYGRVTVQVHCSAPKPWRLFIQASVVVEDYVWKLARSVQRDVMLEKSLLVREKTALGQHARMRGNEIRSIDDVIGLSFNQFVREGTVLTDNMLSKPQMVKKGEAVLLKHSDVQLQLQVRGHALTAGAIGEQVTVKNANSGNTVVGIVVGRGLVETIR